MKLRHDLDDYLGDTLISARAHILDALYATSRENPILDLVSFTKDTSPRDPVLVYSVNLHCRHGDIDKDKDVISSPEGRLYQICPVPKKGLGMAATRRIRRGQPILSEDPLIRQSRFAEDKVTISQFHRLNIDQKQQVISLHNVRPSSGPVMGVIWTNAMPLKGTKEEAGLFATASHINHACSPNTASSWINSLGRLVVHATQDIEAGEEITSTYFKKLSCYEERQEHLREPLGFHCTCWLYLLPAEERRDSDSRIQSINWIHHRLITVVTNNISHTNDLALVRELLGLYEQESIVDWHPAKTYEHVSRIAARNGHGLRAMIFGHRSADNFVVVEGEDSPRDDQHAEMGHGRKAHAKV